MSRMALASAGSTLRMIFSISPLLSAVTLAPAADRARDLVQEGNDPVALGGRTMVDQRDQVTQERVMRRLVELLPLRGQTNLEAPPVLGVVDPLHVALPLELVDDAGHGAEPDAQHGRQRAHAPGTVEVEIPQGVGLRDRQS